MTKLWPEAVKSLPGLIGMELYGAVPWFMISPSVHGKWEEHSIQSRQESGLLGGRQMEEQNLSWSFLTQGPRKLRKERIKNKQASISHFISEENRNIKVISTTQKPELECDNCVRRAGICGSGCIGLLNSNSPYSRIVASKVWIYWCKRKKCLAVRGPREEEACPSSILPVTVCCEISYCAVCPAFGSVPGDWEVLLVVVLGSLIAV